MTKEVMKMDNKKIYKSFRNTLEFLRDGESFVTESEIKLLDDLDEIIKIDRYNAITHELFHKEENLKRLLNIINGKIEQINLLIQNNLGQSNYEYLIKRDKLNELKNDIIAYRNSKLNNIEDPINKLINDCLPSLILDSFQSKFFGKDLVNKERVNSYVTKYLINCDVIDKLYDILDNDSLMNEIFVGVDYIEEENRIKSIIKAYEEALLFKDNIYKHKDLIIEYNMINKRLNKLKSKIDPKTYYKQLSSIDDKLNKYSNIHDLLFNYEKISELKKCKKNIQEEESKISLYENEYNDLKDELSEIENLLKYAGIDEMIEKYDKTISYDHSLSYNMNLFNNSSDIDIYYRNIDKNIDKEKNNLKVAQDQKNDYLNGVSDYCRELLVNDYDTARLIKKFTIAPMKDDLCPAISLFILKILAFIQQNDYRSKCLTESEIRQVVSSFKDDIVSNYSLFLNRYKSIISNNKIYTK